MSEPEIFPDVPSPKKSKYNQSPQKSATAPSVPNAPHVEPIREVALQNPPPVPKYLHNNSANHATKNVHDLVFWGDGDTFKLLCKASSEREGWMKSTKAMEIPFLGVLVQVTTQQRNADGSYSLAEALTYVPGAKIFEKIEKGVVVSRSLVHAR